MKQVAGSLKLDLAQYRELAAFAQFGADLDKATQAQLARGQRMIEILKQDQYSAQRVGNQILIIFAGTNGFIDDIPVKSIRKFEAELLKFLELQHPELANEIEQKKSIDDNLKERMKSAIEAFKKTFVA